MGTEYIDGVDFYRIFSSGARHVIKNRERLNKINVFPVADCDTGSNLAVTLSSAIEFTRVNHSFAETSSSMADAIISGARGNSGIIFAQYILGIAKGAEGKDSIHFKEFIDINKDSSNKLYKVMSNPVEGTILTVIKIWTDYLRNNVDKFKSFEEIFVSSLDIAKIALKNTTNQLEILKKYNLVDSGGNGFVYFLEGIKNQILNISEEEDEYIEATQPDLLNSNKYFSEHKEAHIDYKNLEKNRYCCECMILETAQPCEGLKNELEGLGDSVICVENKGRCRVHVHSSKPQLIFETASKYGNVKMPKIEDMKFQKEAVENKEKIAVVTDSIADIPYYMLDKHKIHVIPLNIQIGESTFIDGLGISRERVYEQMENKFYPSSSMPNEAQVMGKFEFLKKHYDSIIAITVSSKLSGVYDIFRKSAEKLKEEDYNIKVMDSRLNSAAQGLLVIKTAELVAQGKDFETVIDSIRDISEKIEIYVALNTLENARKSGRIPQKTANIGSWLNLKVIISLDSKGSGTAPFLSMSRNWLIDKIYRIVKAKVQTKEISQYAISYSRDLKKALEFAETAERIIGKPPLFICEISSVTALHVGEGAVAISIVN
ncbi:MAG: DegV family protein [Proteocatella sp.]